MDSKLSQSVLLPRDPTLWCDNLSSSHLIVNPIFHARTKHIELYFHFAKEKVASKDLDVRVFSSIDQLSDILTKNFSMRRFNFLPDKLVVATTSQLNLQRDVKDNDTPPARRICRIAN